MSALQTHHTGQSFDFDLSRVTKHSRHGHLIRLLAKAVTLVQQTADATELIREASALIDASDRLEPRDHFPRGGLAPWQVRRVSAHIEKHLDQRISISELAVVAGLSTSYFSTAFRASFGTSPHDYICRQRVQQAKELMLTTDDPMSEIALACGFADQPHFCRVFRRMVSCTPAAWRRRRQVR